MTLKITERLHLDEASSKSCIRISREGSNKIQKPAGNILRKSSNTVSDFVLDTVIPLFLNCASSCRNQTSGESVQNEGSFTDTVFRGSLADTSSSGILLITIYLYNKSRNRQKPNYGIGCGKHRDLVETNFRCVSERTQGHQNVEKLK